MSMNVTIELYYPEEMKAFAVFLNTVADTTAARQKDSLKDGLLGGIASLAQSSVWKTVTEAAAAEDAKQPIAETQEQINTAIGPLRKRGEPSPGHKRRTKAEIAEDEAAAAAEFAPEARRLAAEGNAQFEADRQAAISTGGERVAPDDEPEVAEQDAADEADETAKADAELSHDDVRGAMGKYVEKFGMDAAQIDLPKLFALALKNPEITKVSLIPGDQKSLKIVVDGVNEMLAKNPFSRDAVA